MIPTRQILCGLFVILASICLLTAQQEDGVSLADGQILSEIDQHNELMANLEYLSDVIGPRLTGSAQQNMASEWAEREFRRYNLTNVHQEKWTIARSWTRGTAQARVIAPISRLLAAWRDTGCLSFSRGLHPHLATNEAWRRTFAIGNHKHF